MPEAETAEPGRAWTDRLIRAGARFTALAVVVQTTVHAASHALGDDRSPYLSVNAEHNPVSWSHAAAISASAIVCGLGALRVPRRRAAFLALAALLSFFTVDELIKVHERIVLRVLDALDLAAVWDSVLWPVIYVPFCASFVLVLASLRRDAPRPVRRVLLVGIGSLAVAVAAEIASAPWSDGANLVHTIEGGFEEAAELAGWAAIATGLSALVLPALTARVPITDGPDREGFRRARQADP